MQRTKRDKYFTACVECEEVSGEDDVAVACTEIKPGRKKNLKVHFKNAELQKGASNVGSNKET